MFVFDKRGKRTEATPEDAKGMIEGGGFSALFPKGTPEQESMEYQQLLKDDNHPGAAIARANGGVPFVYQPLAPEATAESSEMPTSSNNTQPAPNNDE